MNIRDTIMREAKRREWSAYRLANEAGMPERTVQSYFSGDRDLAGERIGRLCKALGLELRPARKGK